MVNVYLQNRGHLDSDVYNVFSSKAGPAKPARGLVKVLKARNTSRSWNRARILLKI
jgi:hypothetical protein